MKKVNLFLVGLVTLVTLSVGLSSCGGGSSSSSEDNSLSISKSDFDKLEIIDKGFETDNSFRDKVFLVKNISNEKVDNYDLKIKFYCEDGTSYVDEKSIFLFPGEASMVTFPRTKYVSDVKSWKFLK